MFIFGHIGITLGTFYLLSRLFPKTEQTFDYRYVAFGALLPDLIDKPLGRIILAEAIGGGRIFAHTLLFGCLLLLAGYWLYREKRSSTPLLIPGAAFCHLLEDRMWNSPNVFLWPLFGREFPKDRIGGNFFEYFMIILDRAYDPAFTTVFVSEFIGFVIILAFSINYFRIQRKNINRKTV
ncbi:MAG: metal-dependent hydrolase [Methanosarcinaceae archaeon]|nr:metal-dependent hydrolase [Methanosarcinaceae archaeon]MDD4497473.1 metal-dependent hydrolase [Methanosarcinaceae archaeon]